MGDFGQVGTASLWKSGPLFSTGSSEAEPKMVELRLNPWPAFTRCRQGFADEGVGKGWN